jgi:hypothetical protein
LFLGEVVKTLDRFGHVHAAGFECCLYRVYALLRGCGCVYGAIVRAHVASFP